MKTAISRLLPLAVFLACGSVRAETVVRDLDQGWMFRLTPGEAAGRTHPLAADWQEARVPGSTLADLIRAGEAPDPLQGLNEAKIQWVGLSDWQYRGRLTLTDSEKQAAHLDLVFDGLDTFASVSINGHTVLDADNMFRTWTVADVRQYLRDGENEILVTFRSPIRVMHQRLLHVAHTLPGEFETPFGDEAEGRQSQAYVRKAGYQYGWDWGPRVLTEGIWRGVHLVARDTVSLAHEYPSIVGLDAHVARLNVMGDISLDAPGTYRLQARYRGPDGKMGQAEQTAQLPAGTTGIAVPLSIPEPALWYPVGAGPQPLYQVELAVFDVAGHRVASSTRRIGLRTVELVRDRDGKGRAFGFRVNGRILFAKGASLIPMGIFPGQESAAHRDRLLTMARDANMNMIRVWGGGLYESDALYDRADELGLMVWQDFAFGGPVPPPDAAYAESARQEAREQILRLRHHPSLMLWCGNNEVETGWESWPDRKDYARAIGPVRRDAVVAGMAHLFGGVLPQEVASLDPQTPYWPTSPGTDYDGPANVPERGDMHVWNVWSGSAPIADYLKTTPRFQSEYGLQAMPPMSTLAQAIAPDQMGENTPVMRAHQKFASGDGNRRIGFYLKAEYGRARDFPAFVYLSQVMQADGIALAAEHLRASRPWTLGSLYWQLNDLWPGPSWSAVDMHNRPKALWYRTRAFYAPRMVTILPEGDGFSVSAVSDLNAAEPGHVDVERVSMNGTKTLLLSRDVILAPDAVMAIGHLDRAGLDPTRDVLVATLRVDGKIVSRRILPVGTYRQLALQDPQLSWIWSANGETVTFTARNFAHAVSLGVDGPDTLPDDDFFDLLPGESRMIHFSGPAFSEAVRAHLKPRSLFGATR